MSSPRSRVHVCSVLQEDITISGSVFKPYMSWSVFALRLSRSRQPPSAPARATGSEKFPPDALREGVLRRRPLCPPTRLPPGATPPARRVASSGGEGDGRWPAPGVARLHCRPGGPTRRATVAECPLARQCQRGATRL
ncbi:Protein of unknown function [Gryllus bimaculatus]|nr:Protein of unknown function [Gryllus bimaculatus]